MNTNGQRYGSTTTATAAGQRGPLSRSQGQSQGKRMLNGNVPGGSGSNNELPVVQKRFSQSGVTSVNANLGKPTPKSKRPALGEVSNTVKSRGGNGGAIKAKPSISMTPVSTLSAKSKSVSRSSSSSSSSIVGLKTEPSSSSISSSLTTSSDLSSPLELEQQTKTPNLNVLLDPAEEIRELKEMADIRAVPHKCSYSGAPVIAADREYDEGDENYPEPEIMGESDLFDPRPMGLFDSIPLGVIPEDSTGCEEWPEMENLSIITPAEEQYVSHDDLSDLESSSDDKDLQLLSPGQENKNII